MKKITSALIVILTMIFVFFFILISISGCYRAIPKQLNVITWEGYVPEAAAALFEKETGIKLNISFATDNQRLLALIKGGGEADIVMPTQSNINRYYEADLVQPLDLKIITNYEKVPKSFKEQSWIKWDGKQMGSGEIYAIPYVFGISGLAINTSKYTKNLDNIGWEILFDTGLKGRVSSRNNIESLMLILDLYGIPRDNFITDTQDTLEQIRDKAIALKNNVLKFYTTNAEISDLMKNEEVWVSHIWDGGGRNLSQFDAKFKFVLPKTGGLAWTDSFMISKKAKNPTGANLFIDFMLRPDIAAMLTEQSGFKTTVDGALDIAKGIDKELYKFTDEQLAKLKWNPNLSEEAMSMYIAFQEELSTVQ
jgi:spermidine/putrescine transport system substrate-binding protein